MKFVEMPRYDGNLPVMANPAVLGTLREQKGSDPN